MCCQTEGMVRACIQKYRKYTALGVSMLVIWLIGLLQSLLKAYLRSRARPRSIAKNVFHAVTKASANAGRSLRSAPPGWFLRISHREPRVMIMPS